MPPAPASPPKRMTRARAKAVEEKKQAKPSLQKETASSRAKSKATTEKEQPAKREPPAKPPATRTRQAAASKATTIRQAAPDRELAGDPDADELAAAPSAPVTSVKTRSKKQASAAPSKPTTRATRSAKPATAQKPASTKKVAFEDDKENKTQDPAKADKKKPERDSAASQKQGSSKTTAKELDGRTKDQPELNNKSDRIEPLSPKKGYQTSADAQPSSRPGSSDKDCPIPQEFMFTSPAKRSIQIPKEPVPREDCNARPEPPQPSVIASPAKRPPPAIQDGLKFESQYASEKTDEPDDAGPTSILSRSPVRLGGLGSNNASVFPRPNNNHSSAVLSQSPARRPPSPIKLGEHSNVSATPQEKLKTYLQSPARRPPATMHTVRFGSQKPQENSSSRTPMTSSRLQQKPMKFSMPPPKNPFASPERLRADAEKEASNKASGDTLDLIMAEPPRGQEPDAQPTPRVRDSVGGSFEFNSPPVQWSSDAESEDELNSNDPKFDASPTRRRSAKAKEISSPATPLQPQQAASEASEQTLPMTVLAERFGAWAGATPDQAVLKSRNDSLPAFAIPEAAAESPAMKHSSPVAVTMEALESSFDEAMQVHEDEDDHDELMQDAPNAVMESFRTSQISDASQDYGDENASPADASQSLMAAREVATCTPKNVFAKHSESSSNYTVSKVPLKPASEDELPRKKSSRSKSLSGVLTPLKQSDDRIAGARKQREAQTARASRFVENLPETSASKSLQTPSKSSSAWSAAPTPARTPRADLNGRLLSGAVVFVDVHTTEGADASEIFVDLLSQMGARCVKSWSWNPNASASDLESGDSRVGITHVVFKDGGIRTMQKVRETKGLVQCVGVGWVLE